jgi:glycosyltransferase 2 family protein
MDRLNLARKASGRAKWLVLRWAVGIAIVTALVLRFDARGIADELGGADLRLAFPALVGLVAIHIVGAFTWRDLAGRLSAINLGLGEAIRRYYVAQAIGALTPANLGADAYRLIGVEGGDARYGWRQMLLPVLVQRITSSIALAGLGLAALALLPAGGAANGAALAILVLAAGSSALIVALQAGGRWSRWIRWPWHRGPAELSAESADPAVKGKAGPRAALVAIAVGLGLGLAFHAGSVLLSYVLVLSVGVSASPVTVLACLVVARLSILIPISPSGLGIQEGALSLLFLSIGLPAETALAASLLNRLALIATTLLGSGLMLLAGSPVRARSPSRLRARAPGRMP